jgi:hypothetical protein
VDLFGPPSNSSLGGKKYCLVIVDDYSRYTWVYFFEYKSETQQTIIDLPKKLIVNMGKIYWQEEVTTARVQELHLE